MTFVVSMWSSKTRAHDRSRFVAVALLTSSLSGCGTGTIYDPISEVPSVGLFTKTGLDLSALPQLKQQVPISVFEFPDLTGQHKPSDRYAEFSRAVTQGGLPILIDSMKTACGGKCFKVIERAGLKNLLQERQIIEATRGQFQGAGASKLPPLTFAGVLIEGGIVGYDTNTLTGGAGAKYLGVGGDTKYRYDQVTVGMRLVSVQNGEVLASVTTSKSIYSMAVQGSAFRYVKLDSLFEAEAGVTRNEPPQLAVREAVELATYSLIMEGARKNMWGFTDSRAGAEAVANYMKRKNKSPAEKAEMLAETTGTAAK
jgi:curli production assembly/transport component CsgG